MEEKSKGKLYEILIFTLLLLRSKLYKCDIGKEVQVAEKFDDCVVRYQNNEKSKYICCQAKLVDNGDEKIITEDVLLGKKKISLNINDFNLKKYFRSFLNIRESLAKINSILEKLIIFSNVSDIDGKLIEKKDGRNLENINNIFQTTSSTKIFNLNKTGTKKIRKELLKISDFNNLVNKLKNYATLKNFQQNKIQKVPTMKKDDEILSIYRYSLFEEMVLKVEINTNSTENHDWCQFHENFVYGNDISLEAEELRRKLQIDKFEKKQLLALKWKCNKQFNEFDENIPNKLPQNIKITNEDVDEFLDKLEFYVGQPNLNELKEEIKKETSQHFSLYSIDIETIIENQIKDWRQRKIQKEDWITNEEKEEFFQELNKTIDSLQVESVSNLQKDKWMSIINQYDIQCSIDGICGFEQFITNITEENKNGSCFIKTNETYFTAIKLAFYFQNYNNVLYLKDEDFSTECAEKLMDFNENYNTIVVECQQKYKQLQKYINSEENSNKRLILFGKDNYYDIHQEFIDEKLIIMDNIKNESKILQKQIKWQGNIILLNELIEENSNVLNKLISTKILKELLQSDEIPNFGNELIYSKSDVNILKYIDRTLDQTIIKKTVFEDELINNYDRFIIISDDQIDNNINIKQNNSVEIHSSENGYNYFQDLCQKEENRNIHLLEYKNGFFIWKCTKGSMDNLIRFKEEIVEDKKQCFIRESEISSVIKYNKFCAISGVSGMGKSTILSNIYKQFIFCSNVVIRFNLSEYQNIFENINQPPENVQMAINLLINMINKNIQNNDNFDKRFAKHCLLNKQEKIIILFDAFDEIYLDCGDLVLKLFNLLKCSKIQKILITTRPNVLEKLEKCLSVFSLNLNQFTQMDQIEFLRNNFSEELKIDNINNAKLEIYISAILEKFNESINDKIKSFTGIPLLLNMIAKIFVKNDKILEKNNINNFESCENFLLKNNNQTPHLPDKLDLIYLYEQFIKRIYFIWQLESKQEIKYTKQNERTFKSLYENFLNSHQKYSLLLFSSNDKIVSLINENVQDNFNTDFENIKHGLIIGNNNGIPQFLHQSFAEYLIATFIFEKISKQSKLNDSIQKFIMREILINDIFVNIRAFLNVIFLKNINNNELFSINICTLNDKIELKILKKACYENNEKIFDLVFHNLKRNNKYEDVVKFIDLNKFLPISINSFNNELITKSLIDSGANVNIEVNIDGGFFDRDKSLHLAVRKMNINIVKLLIDSKAVINIQNRYGDTPLHVATKNNSTDIITLLINSGANVNLHNFLNESPLKHAMITNNKDLVKLFARYLNCEKCKNKQICVYKIILEEDLNTIRNVINELNVNLRDQNGDTPLHLAVLLQNPEIVKFLLNSNADVNILNARYDSVLHFALICRNLNIVKMLLDAGVDVNQQDKHYGCTALHYATMNGNIDMMKLLISNGANVNIQESDGRVPLHYACQNNNLNAVKLLIESNANVNVTCSDGFTALTYSIDINCDLDLIKYLIFSGANVNTPNRHGFTPLYFSVINNDLDLVKVLVNSGANIDPSILDLAKSEKNDEIINFLLETKEK